MKSLRLAALAAAGGLALAVPGRAQDSHYWTNQYGTRATLLGGAVIGSVLDLSGTFYNPGGMSLIEEPQTLMAAKAFQYPHVTVLGSEGGSVHLNSANLAPAPSLVAGTFRIRGLKGHWFGYSFLSRQDVKLGVAVTSAGVRDVLLTRPGNEDYATLFRIDEKMSEPWLGLTWSVRVRSSIGIGVSQYFVLRTHRGSVQSLVEALDAESRLGLAFGSRQYHYQNGRLLWKVGLAVDMSGVSLGLTLTTPSVKLFGSGSVGINTTIAGLDVDGDGSPDDIMAAGCGEGLPAVFRTPLSLAAGWTLKLGSVRVYGSAEWFARIRPYTVVDAEEFEAQMGGVVLSPDVTHELRPVINFGLGLEVAHSERFKSYASFTTDRAAKRPGTATNLSLADWDIHHLVAGAEIALKSSALTFGLGYSFGNREVGTRADLIDRGGVEPMWDPFEGLRFRYASYKVLAGFAF